MKESEKPINEMFPLTNNTSRTSPPMKTTNVSKAGKPSRTGWTYTKWALVGAFCLTSVLAGTFVGNFYWKSPDIVRTLINNKIFHPLSDPLANYKPDIQFPVERQHEITLLLLGTDYELERGRPVPIKGKRGRSDAMLLAKVNFDTGTIRAMSIPRDCYVHIPDHGYTRINAAHAFGGPELTKETIKQVFGIGVDYYAAFNFEGFQKVVDALGGIDLDVQRDMKYDDNWGNLHIDLKKGYQHLTGYQAMGYVRYRHGDNDMKRAERQQQFIEALRGKIKSPTTLASLPNVLNALMDNLSTDMTTDQMMTLGNYARGLKREDIELSTVPVVESTSYVYVKVLETEELIRRLFYPDGLTSVSVNVPPRSAMVVKNDRGERRRKNGRKGRRTEAVGIQTPDTAPESLTPDNETETPPMENTEPSPTEVPDTGTKPDEGGSNPSPGKPSGGETPSSGGGEPSESGNSA